MIAGKANTIISATTSIAQAKTGIRPSVMPGARVNRMPTISSIAPAIAEISMKPMPSSHQSAPSAGRVLRAGERRVHEPAAVGRDAEEDRAEERQPADRVGPEGVGRQARERQVAGAEHARQQVDGDRLDDRHGEQEHHHRAVHGEDLVVGLRRRAACCRAARAARASAARARRRARRTAARWRCRRRRCACCSPPRAAASPAAAPRRARAPRSSPGGRGRAGSAERCGAAASARRSSQLRRGRLASAAQRVAGSSRSYAGIRAPGLRCCTSAIQRREAGLVGGDGAGAECRRRDRHG